MNWTSAVADPPYEDRMHWNPSFQCLWQTNVNKLKSRYIFFNNPRRHAVIKLLHLSQQFVHLYVQWGQISKLVLSQILGQGESSTRNTMRYLLLNSGVVFLNKLWIFYVWMRYLSPCPVYIWSVFHTFPCATYSFFFFFSEKISCTITYKLK